MIRLMAALDELTTRSHQFVASVALASILVACTDVAAPRNRASHTPFKMGNVVIQSDGRVVYPATPGFVEASRSVIRGTRSARGGCTFRSKDQLAHGEHITLSVLELDPSTCDFTVARDNHTSVAPNVSVNPGSVSAPTQKGSSSFKIPTPKAAFGSCANGCTEGTFYNQTYSSGLTVSGESQAFVSVYDPIGYVVLENGNKIDFWWSTNTGCMQHAVGYYHKMYAYWDDWREYNHNNWSGGTTCAYSRGTVYAQYTNALFCEFTSWPGTVYAEFYNSVTSHPLYQLGDFDTEVTLDNGCAFMLHYNIEKYG
jgi:hypothetical protein